MIRGKIPTDHLYKKGVPVRMDDIVVGVDLENPVMEQFLDTASKKLKKFYDDIGLTDNIF